MLREISKKEFREFAKTVSQDFMQSIEMYERYVERGNETYLVGLFEDEKMTVAALLVSKRKILGQKFFISPRGFLMDFGSPRVDEIVRKFTVEVQKFLKEKGGAVLEISPNLRHVVRVDEKGKPVMKGEFAEDLLSGGNWNLGEKVDGIFKKNHYKNVGEFEFVKWIYTLDLKEFLDGKNLDLDNEENKKFLSPVSESVRQKVLAHFKQNHRWTMKTAVSRYGLRVRELPISEIEILKRLSDEAGERHEFVTPSVSYYQEMKKAYGEKVKFLVAEAPGEKVAEFENVADDSITEDRVCAGDFDDSGVVSKEKEWVPVAAAMFVIHEDEIIYLFSGSSAKYKKLGGPYLLQEKIILEAVRRGCRKYNFYGTDPFEEGGVYLFKRGFHGQLEEYLGTYLLPISLVGKIYVAKQKYQVVRNIH